MLKSIGAENLKEKFGEQFKTNISIAPYTSARIGGLADGLLVANSLDELISMSTYLWEEELPFIVLGGGSNVLVSDAGIRGLVLLNKSRKVVFDGETDPPTVWAASGTNFGKLARQTAQQSLSGLEWAAGIPGTVGGAVFGNAGAHGGDVAGNLLVAEILHRDIEDNRSENGNSPVMTIRREEWTAEQFKFSYRSSLIKEEITTGMGGGEGERMGWLEKNQPAVIVLAALMRLAHSNQKDVEALIDEYTAYRRKTQPPGASMGSMFKNPPGDYAGRLIEEAGLKGIRVGDASISSLHGNFFINYGNATASDVWELINLAKNIVSNRFGIEMELEIQLVGEWQVDRKS
jgi:UDP-N-acetylmuramate dehydrogenase